MIDETTLDALRAHARVAVDDGDICVWLFAPYAFLVVSALVVVGSLTTEGVLIAYAREQAGPGAWAIVVIVSIWLLAVSLMIRRRWRALRSTPTLRLGPDELRISDGRTVRRAAITGARAVERSTYACVEVSVGEDVVSITLARPEQGPPLAALLAP